MERLDILKTCIHTAFVTAPRVESITLFVLFSCFVSAVQLTDYLASRESGKTSDTQETGTDRLWRPRFIGKRGEQFFVHSVSGRLGNGTEGCSQKVEGPRVSTQAASQHAWWSDEERNVSGECLSGPCEQTGERTNQYEREHADGRTDERTGST